MKKIILTSSVGCLLIANPAVAELPHVSSSFEDPLVRSTVDSSSTVLHKGYTELSEEDNEATAATAVIIKKVSDGPLFNGTHPFIYLIRDMQTGAILFMGRMMDHIAK